MTSAEPELARIAIVGTGLIGTSIAMAADRVGCAVTGWDADALTAGSAGEHGGFAIAPTLEACVAGADIVLICTPIPTIAPLAVEALGLAPHAVVTDVGSIKSHVIAEVEVLAAARDLSRFVGGHPMGGSERSGPDHAAPSIVDGIVWVLTPGARTGAAAVDHLEAWVRMVGGHPVRLEARRHDRLVAFVSHLPQVASTALMGLVAIEEANEPEILLLAAGGFRDLTRLAVSNPAMWSDILVSNGEAIAEAIDLYIARLATLRDLASGGRDAEVRAAFAAAKKARLTLATKPQVRAGVAVLQVGVPDRPGALARLTGALAGSGVNIEDLQIVHSPEGGRGAVHLTVAAESASEAASVLAGEGFDPVRLA